MLTRASLLSQMRDALWMVKTFTLKLPTGHDPIQWMVSLS